MAYPIEKIQQRWIQDKVDDAAVNWAKSFGEFLQTKDQSNPLTTSQIRKFFGELKRIQADPEKYQDDVPLLKAKLAYAVGRETVSNSYGKSFVKTKIKEFHEELEKGINFIRPGVKKDLVNFVKLIEAIVAYHKYFGGK